MTIDKKIFLTIVLSFFAAACSSSDQVELAQATAQPTTSVLSTALPTPVEVGCSTIQMEATPAVAQSSDFPAVNESDHILGAQDAAVTVIEYCDFQTQACHDLALTMQKIMQRQPEDVRFVFRPIPLLKSTVYPNSQLAAQAAYAAGQQDKFWQMYELLHLKYAQWAGLPPAGFESWLMKEVPELGVDAEKFRLDLKSSEAESTVRAWNEALIQLGVTSVPLMLINGIPQQTYVSDFSSLNRMIGVIALGQKQFGTCPAFDIDITHSYIATLKTQKGEIVIRLFPEKAPLAVNSFVFLARQGWYDGVTFHRVLPGFIAQTGDPSGTGAGNPGYFYKDEADNGLKFDKPGVVGMANSGLDSNGSQFFITYASQPTLDGVYTVFGQVIKGMDVLEQLTARDPQQTDDIPMGDVLISVSIEEK